MVYGNCDILKGPCLNTDESTCKTCSYAVEGYKRQENELRKKRQDLEHDLFIERAKEEMNHG